MNMSVRPSVRKKKEITDGRTDGQKLYINLPQQVLWPV